ncbi:hypothetical protein GEMRC1_009435 [Eukaryota sp. GEM-RC1]
MSNPCIDDGLPEHETVTVMSAKQIKQFVRPQFEASPDDYYPTEIMKTRGFTRSQCPKCNHFYWRHSDSITCCGDSNCLGEYQFIGTGEAWDGYERIFSSNTVPSTAIDRYPVVARWRNDIDFVAAGIFCFQPYCVTGELEPPLTPLICPQFCLRFNDLDSIGLSGRHHSGFVMIGNQVFNSKEKYVYFQRGKLEISLDDITLIEDVWSGGGNLGPCVEIFVKGLEVGNMVFMEYRYAQDGSLHKLDVQVVDVGIGLERIPWLINGTLTSYLDVYPDTLSLLSSIVGVPLGNETWEKFARYSCLLNVDECDDVAEAFNDISKQLQMDSKSLVTEIAPLRDLFIICDHTRTILMAITDGCLPSSVGGGFNLRNLLRRVFSIMIKNDWMEKVGLEGLFKLFDSHRLELAGIYGEFAPYSSFNSIIEIEFDRWKSSDEEAKKKLKTVLKKNPILELNDWIKLVTSFGLSPDKIAEISGQTVPSNLYYEIAERQEKVARKEMLQLYEVGRFNATGELFYDVESQNEWSATVLGILENPVENNRKNVIVLDQTAVYPTSGGQDHDNAILMLESGAQVNVIDAIRVGKVVLHMTDTDLTDDVIGTEVVGILDRDRRNQLRQHHTATHIIHAASVEVLGPHVWQNGAKKTAEIAHLDITHYRSLTREEETTIEERANEIVNQCINISISDVSKKEAEAEHGFSLYQGGVVPGNTLRVVDINGVDQEACCGTHCTNTGQVGFVRLIRSNRISDGIVRLYFVAGKKAREFTIDQGNREAELCRVVSMQPEDLIGAVSKYFEGFKKFDKFSDGFVRLCLDHLTVPTLELSSVFVRFDPPNTSMYSMIVPPYCEKLKQLNRNILFVGTSYIYGLLGDPSGIDLSQVEGLVLNQFKDVADFNKKKAINSRTKIVWSVKDGKKRVKKSADNVLEISIPRLRNSAAVLDYFIDQGFSDSLLE